MVVFGSGNCATHVRNYNRCHTSIIIIIIILMLRAPRAKIVLIKHVRACTGREIRTMVMFILIFVLFIQLWKI